MKCADASNKNWLSTYVSRTTIPLLIPVSNSVKDQRIVHSCAKHKLMTKKLHSCEQITLKKGLEFSSPFFYFFQVPDSGKVLAFHFCSHYETLTTCNHSNVRLLTVKMATQSTVIFRTEQHLVEVMIFTSLTMPTLIKTRIVTLATHTKN